MAEIHRIGRWTSKAALEEAEKHVEDDDPIVIISLTKDMATMRCWSASSTNMQVNWMLDNMKMDIFFGRD